VPDERNYLTYLLVMKVLQYHFARIPMVLFSILLMHYVTDYEKVYNDAREALHRRGKRVGGPRRDSAGSRQCLVDGFPLTDRDLLREAWGENLTNEILIELADGDSHHCCAEGNLLWRRYLDTRRRNLKALFEPRDQDSVAIAQLTLMLQQAAECRREARRALLDHAATHHTCRAA
jgi:hypothetical protein